MRTAKRILGIILIFLFGVFVGAAVTGGAIVKKTREVMMGGPKAVMETIVNRLDTELKLDAEQKRKLQTIVDDAHIKLRQSQDKIQPEINGTLFEAEQQVRSILYQHQVAKFDQIVNRSREKWERWQERKEKGPPVSAGETVPPKEKAPASTPAETPKPTENAPPSGASE
jgi:flagellar basal body-associated protein FliL